MEGRVDIGYGHSISYACWAPDRELNPQYDGIPDVDKYGVIVYHKTKDDGECSSFATFDGEVARKIEPTKPKWQVLSLEPLHIEPSLLCLRCGDHGHIRGGRWEPA